MESLQYHVCLADSVMNIFELFDQFFIQYLPCSDGTKVPEMDNVDLMMALLVDRIIYINISIFFYLNTILWWILWSFVVNITYQTLGILCSKSYGRVIRGLASWFFDRDFKKRQSFLQASHYIKFFDQLSFDAM